MVRERLQTADLSASTGDDQSRESGSIEDRMREGCALLWRGRLDEALAAFEAAIALEPDNAQAHNKRGVVLAEKGMLDEAKLEFERALALDPKYASAMSNLGNTFREKNMLDEAAELYKMALTIDPDHATAHHNLGVVYKQMGMIDRAIVHFKQAQRSGLRRDTGAERLAPAKVGRYLWIIAAVLVVTFFLLSGK